ncbi:MAG: FHA domain-containing protein [Bacteroidetes bacterium]|nr:FHA domain-containing protein [Bacteroidota bacterium]MBU1718127.1 FHA domain-containing protein [Bacteroidota bacterium]
MRCNNCGYQNTTGPRCEKCNYLLTSAENSLSNSFIENKEPAKTIAGAKVKDAPWDCKQCGYPVIQGSETCPKCGYHFDIQSKDSFSQKEKFHKNKPVSEKTIDPYNRGFKLKPVPVTHEADLNEIHFSAQESELMVGRETLEPQNQTISAEQANFYQHNGKWFIKDVSSKKSTFVLANEFIELSEGDVVMMGNRRFVFSSK